MIGRIFKTIFGEPTVVKGALDLLDDLHTSGPEAIAAKTEARVALLKAYAPFKIAQRLLMLSFTFVFLASFSLVLGMKLSGKDVSDVYQVLNEFYIAEIELMIVIFYFGSGAAEGIIDKLTERIAGKKIN